MTTMIKKKIVTLQVEVEMDLIGNEKNDAVLQKAIEKLSAPSLNGIAKIGTIRDTNALVLSDIKAGLIIEHEKYGLGIIVDIKTTRKYPVGVCFVNNKSYNFASTNGMKASNVTFEELHKKMSCNSHGYFYDGNTGYYEYKGITYPMLVVPFNSKTKYKIVPVYKLTDDTPQLVLEVPTELMKMKFKHDVY